MLNAEDRQFDNLDCTSLQFVCQPYCDSIKLLFFFHNKNCTHTFASFHMHERLLMLQGKRYFNLSENQVV